MSKRTRRKVFTVTRDDCKWEYFRAGGSGGQNQNKRDSACRVIHPPSGAIGESREERKQWQNRKNAFKRMANSPKFREWAIKAASEDLALATTVEAVVEDSMRESNLLVEVWSDGKWIALGVEEE